MQPPRLRANARASRVFAMHANDRGGLHARGPVHVVQMNHRHAAVRVAFTARLDACLAADAARWIQEKFGLGSHGESTIFSIRQAQTLNSGILEIGSSARLVSWLADFLPGQ